MKVQKVPSINEMSKSDRMETYEMLRASHTLLRMAYGAVALFGGITDEKEVKAFNSHFDYVFKRIAATAESFVAPQSGDKPAN